MARFIWLISILLLSSFVFAQENKAQNKKSQPPPPPTTHPAEAEKEETIKIDSTLVTIPVSVIDREGRYLLNLTNKDFKLYEENSPQEITNFSALEVPINVVLMLDTSRSTKFRIVCRCHICFRCLRRR